MTTYHIESRVGQYLGDYEGDTAEDAVRALHRDAGYRTDADICAALWQTWAEVMAEYIVREVSP